MSVLPPPDPPFVLPDDPDAQPSVPRALPPSPAVAAGVLTAWLGPLLQSHHSAALVTAGTPAALHRWLADAGDLQVRAALARLPQLAPDALAVLWAGFDPATWAEAPAGRLTPDQHRAAVLLAALVARPDTPPALVAAAAGHHRAVVRAAAAASPLVTPADIRRIFERSQRERDWTVLDAIAASPVATPAAVAGAWKRLSQLAGSAAEVELVQRLAAHPATSASTLLGWYARWCDVPYPRALGPAVRAVRQALDALPADAFRRVPRTQVERLLATGGATLRTLVIERVVPALGPTQGATQSPTQGPR